MIKSATCALWILLLGSCLPLPAEGGGEFCHGWLDSYNTWHRGFSCPEQYDSVEARYCCGTCSLRYCCTSAEARLDQSTCEADDFTTNNGKGRTMSPTMPTYLPFVIVVGAFLSFVLVGTVVSVCCCHCLKPKSADHHSGLTPTQTSLLESGGAGAPGALTPSRDSSSSGSSVGRSTATTRPSGSDGTVNAYPPMGNMYPTLGLQQPQHFASPAHLQGQFYQPYLNYSVPPEHTMITAPVFLDTHAAYRQQHGQPFPQAPMHTEPICPPGMTL
ncbi:shisa family member 2a [Engraulis encrasicolus]|uniref:shisa family member 2a n=1 Tax=Engraulis encrasicolus TaxID=184585 RepID=UPI002FD07061